MSASSPETAFVPEPEDLGVVAATWNVGIRLLISAIGFVAVSFLFAFFYLKAVNSNGNWRPAHVNPSQGWGIAILVGVIATALVFEVARRGLTPASLSRWRGLAGVAVALAVAVLVVDVLQLTQTNFGVTGGGYASVFYGWNAMSIAVWLGAVYWVETLFAVSLHPTAASGHIGGEPVEILQRSASACVAFLYAVAGITVVFYVLLYLIK